MARNSQENQVAFQWVVAHKGIKGNSIADKLAKDATKIKSNLTRIYLSNKDTTKRIREEGQKEWKTAWKEAPHRETKLWLPKLDQVTTDQLLRLNKKTLSRVIQMITGFNNLRNHTGRVNDTEKTCRLCKEKDETGWHLARECPKTQNIRLKEDWEVSNLAEWIAKDPIRTLLDSRVTK